MRHILRRALGISECEVVVGFYLEQMCDPSGFSSCWWRSSRCWHQCDLVGSMSAAMC